MAGNLLISQALLVLVTINGVFSMRTTPQHSAPHMCQASDESSEEGCRKTPQNSNAHAHRMQNSVMGPLMASDFDVTFYLYNGDKRPNYDFKYETFDNSMARQKFIPGAPLKILIHGFLNNGKSLFPTNVRDAYLKRMEDTHNNDKYNVIVYDWGKGACASMSGTASSFRPYNNAAANVEEAGRKLGDMLVKFQNLGIANISTEVHLIGHSLGSHVAGHAGRQVYEETKQTGNGQLVWRISALDPAGPFFWKDKMLLNTHHQDPFLRLHRNRVHYLDVYHTSKDYGSVRKIGNVDFFINGGKSQDSCKIELNLPFRIPFFGSKIPIYVFDTVLQVCSHNFATDIFAKSINDETMRACTGCYSYEEFNRGQCHCEDNVKFGEFADAEKLEGYPITYGTAYLNTPKNTSIGSNYLQIMRNSDFDMAEKLKNALSSLCFFNFIEK